MIAYDLLFVPFAGLKMVSNLALILSLLNFDSK